MQGYQCNRCLFLGVADEIPKRFYQDDDGDTEAWICPKCGGEDFANVEICDMCESERTHEDYGLCIACAQSATSTERLSDVLREIALTPEKVK